MFIVCLRSVVQAFIIAIAARFHLIIQCQTGVTAAGRVMDTRLMGGETMAEINPKRALRTEGGRRTRTRSRIYGLMRGALQNLTPNVNLAAIVDEDVAVIVIMIVTVSAVPRQFGGRGSRHR